jgi:hypothetical protein
MINAHSIPMVAALGDDNSDALEALKPPMAARVSMEGVPVFHSMTPPGMALPLWVGIFVLAGDS